MNGTDREDYGGRTVYENAEISARTVIESAVRFEDMRQPNPDWDPRAEVFERQTFRMEQFTIGLNGPTEYLCFVFKEDGDMDHAYLHYSSAGDSAIVQLGQFDAEDLYERVKDYR